MTIKAAGFRYIPKGAVKVADKKSDAVAYLYATPKGEPALMVFYGKQSKPAVAFRYAKPEARERALFDYFGARQKTMAYKAEQKAKRKAQGRGVEVGQYLKASWGYEQTNVDFYQVTKLIGTTMAEVQKVGNNSVADGGNMSGKVIPAENDGKGKTYRVVVKNGGARINDTYAGIWDGTPAYVSWYA